MRCRKACSHWVRHVEKWWTNAASSYDEFIFAHAILIRCNLFDIKSNVLMINFLSLIEFLKSIVNLQLKSIVIG